MSKYRQKLLLLFFSLVVLYIFIQHVDRHSIYNAASFQFSVSDQVTSTVHHTLTLNNLLSRINLIIYFKKFFVI